MFLHRMLRPPYLEADEHLSVVMTMLDDVVVMAHTQPDDWDFFDQFRSLANNYRDRFSFVAAPPIGDTSVLVCYSNIDDEKHTASDVVTVGAMESFINMCAEPLIPDRTEGDDARYRSVSSTSTDSTAGTLTTVG
jgi:protein disulfide-isomerase A1